MYLKQKLRIKSLQALKLLSWRVKKRVLIKPILYKIKTVNSLVSQKEILEVIKSVKNNKTPGPDGYPIDFYKIFFEQFIFILEKTFNHILSVSSI